MIKWPEELHALFHELWTRDVGTKGYDKKKWQQLEKWIYVLLKYPNQLNVFIEKLKGDT